MAAMTTRRNAIINSTRVSRVDHSFITGPSQVVLPTVPHPTARDARAGDACASDAGGRASAAGDRQQDVEAVAGGQAGLFDPVRRQVASVQGDDDQQAVAVEEALFVVRRLLDDRTQSLDYRRRLAGDVARGLR